jgi:hypothetical protein
MSANVATPENLKDTGPVMRSGEEPPELLLALAWSPIETLQRLGLAKVFVGSGAVAVIFQNTSLLPEKGLVPTLPQPVAESVGSPEAG